MESCVAVGRAIGSLFYYLSRRYRRLVRNNLRIVHASKPLDDSDLDDLVGETFRRAGANFLAALRMPLLPKDELMDYIIDDGLELMGSGREKGSGLVIALPHMGNWEALSQTGSTFIAIAGISYGGVYRPLNNPLMDEFTHSRRTADGAQLFSRKDGFNGPAKLLRDCGTLAVLSDQRAGSQGIAMPFMGKMTTCTPLPYLLSRRAKARVCNLAIISEPGSKWRMTMREISGTIDTKSVMAGLEDAMRSSASDVFWFHDRWRIDRVRPLSLYTALDPDVAATASVPLRLLLTMPDHSDEEHTDALISRMLELRPDLRIEFLQSDTPTTKYPKVINHAWDPDLSPEQMEGVLSKMDAAYPSPIDGLLLFGGEIAMARAARYMGIRCIMGTGKKRKPWSHTIDKPQDAEGWRAIADELAWVPDRYRK